MYLGPVTIVCIVANYDEFDINCLNICNNYMHEILQEARMMYTPYSMQF